MAFFLCIKYDKKKFDVFNLATSKSTSILELAKIFAKIMDKSELRPIFKNGIPGVVKCNSTNNQKLQNVLGFTPSIKLKSGLSNLLQSI